MRRKIDIQENWIDKAIKYVSPVKAAERLKARMTMALAGGYTGASKSRRSLSEWNAGRNDADTDLLPNLAILRERSRDLVRNNPLAAGAINTVCTNVIGTGLRLQIRVDREFLNLNDDEADQWAADTEREFALWADSKDCDIGRNLSFYDLQELVFRSTLENGDCFILMPFISRMNSPYSLRLQVIEADRVVNKDRMADSDTLAGGIKKDAFGAPIEYHILEGHPGSIYSLKKWIWKVIPAFGIKTGRRNVLHLYRALRPGQTRGVPYLAPVIESLKQLGTYTDAEIMAAVVSGMLTVFIKTPDGEANLEPSQPASQGDLGTSENDYKLGNGAIIGLAEGEDISTVNPGRPNAAFDPFVQAILRQIGVALELPFEILIKHFTASYSAARAALLEAWKFFNARRQWLTNNFCQLVYEEWLTEAVALGRVKAPGFLNGDPAIRKAYASTVWIGPSQGQIDPLKEIEAATKRIEIGVSSIAREAAALTGIDWEDEFDQQVKEYRMRKAAGLIQEMPAQTMPTGTDQVGGSPANSGGSGGAGGSGGNQ
jgi:lambda family phage portal protein